MFNNLFSHVGALTSGQLDVLTSRTALSDFLPYCHFKQYRTEISESGEEEIFEVNEFLNSDATYGHIFECTPLTFVGLKSLNSLHGVLKQPYPVGTVVQFILYTDHDMTDVIQGFRAGKTFNDELAQRSADETEKWLELCAKGNPKMAGIPARLFKCMVAIKSPQRLDYRLIAGVRNNLQTAGMQPRAMNDVQLKSMLGKIINNKRVDNPRVSPDRELRKQIIGRSTRIKFETDKTYGEVANRYVCCLTPGEVTNTNDPLQTNQLFGGYNGANDDVRQITTPFLYSLNVVIEDVKAGISNKNSVVQWQRLGRSMSYKLDNSIEEFSVAMKSIERDKQRHYRFIPCMWIFGSDRKEMERGAGEVETLWNEHGFEMQRERLVKSPLFIASLPFGFYNVENNINNLDRHYIATTEDIARFLPVQGDFTGSGFPTVIYYGRKGQVVGLNHFDKRVNAYNFLVAGGTGSGKSFILNDQLGAYADAGYKIRATDMGGGYEKLCAQKKGRYFDFRLAREIPCINPLDFQAMDDEDYAKNLDAVLAICGMMANSQTGEPLDELESQVMRDAIVHTLKAGNQEAGAEGVIQYLRDYRLHGHQKGWDKVVRVAERMAYTMKEFGKGGQFEKLFCGKNQFNISDDKFVVVELEHVRSIKQLYQVVTLQMMNSITQDLYLGDRATQTVILFEEVISFLNKNGQTDTSRYAGMIEEGYRRARKYRGSMGVVLQSALDINQMGDIGKVVNSQAIFKYYLESSAFDEAVQTGAITGIKEGFMLNLLNSVASQRPRYSEFFLDAGVLGKGVLRLCVDPWRYGVNTSDGDDFKLYNHMLTHGFTKVQAIETVAGIKDWRQEIITESKALAAAGGR